MKTVKFDTKDSYTDYGLYLQPYTIPMPDIKSNYIDIAGADGTLDLTEVFGRVRFMDRTFTLDLRVFNLDQDFHSTITTFANAVHGKRVKITFSDDPGYYYYGRVDVDTVSPLVFVGVVTVFITAAPWKYKTNVTSVTEEVTTSKKITLTNDRMPTIPTITVDAEMSLAWGTNTVTLSAGTHTVLDLELQQGNTSITVTGTGTITFAYQEGAL